MSSFLFILSYIVSLRGQKVSPPLGTGVTVSKYTRPTNTGVKSVRNLSFIIYHINISLSLSLFTNLKAAIIGLTIFSYNAKNFSNEPSVEQVAGVYPVV